MTQDGRRHLRRGVADEEDASVMRLGPEFQNAETMFLSEVKVILDLLQDRKTDSEADASMTPVFKKTQEYVDTFARFKDKSTVDAVRAALQQQEGMYGFELAQLANLCVEDVDEAKSLVASLGVRGKDDESLQALLNEITSLRKFQGT